MGLQIVELSKRYDQRRARGPATGGDPELAEDGVAELEALPEDERDPLASAQDQHWALRDITVTIERREKVGIIGANGSGKTTLLNILAGITLPTHGSVRGQGRRVLLNSLRSPFRSDLTGRKNLHILTALLGVEAAELEARMTEILAFSGMQELIDRRVMHYSSQQYQRLSFAAALMLDPEIILSDGVLGVGDARYKQRGQELIGEKVEREGVIFMFASNNLRAVSDLCTRVIWLEGGMVAADGPTEQVIESFLSHKGEADAELAADMDDEVPVPLARLRARKLKAEDDGASGSWADWSWREQAHHEQPEQRWIRRMRELDEEREADRASSAALRMVTAKPPPETQETPTIEWYRLESAAWHRNAEQRWIKRMRELDEEREADCVGKAAWGVDAWAAMGHLPQARLDASDAWPLEWHRLRFTGDARRRAAEERWIERWADVENNLQHIGVPEMFSSGRPLRTPLPEWSMSAAQAVKRRRSSEQRRVARWIEGGRRWLVAEKSNASLPGLGALEGLRFTLTSAEAGIDHSPLEVALRLDRPGTEVSVFVDGMLGPAHVFAAELPAPLIAPSSGLFFFTVKIDNALLQPRVAGGPYVKAKLRVKAFLRPPDNAEWQLLNGFVRLQLQGEQWEPRIPYPPERKGPFLKPVLGWRVERAVDDSAGGAERVRPAAAVPEQAPPNQRLASCVGDTDVTVDGSATLAPIAVRRSSPRIIPHQRGAESLDK